MLRKHDANATDCQPAVERWSNAALKPELFLRVSKLGLQFVFLLLYRPGF